MRFVHRLRGSSDARVESIDELAGITGLDSKPFRLVWTEPLSTVLHMQ